MQEKTVRFHHSVKDSSDFPSKYRVKRKERRNRRKKSRIHPVNKNRLVVAVYNLLAYSHENGKEQRLIVESEDDFFFLILSSIVKVFETVSDDDDARILLQKLQEWERKRMSVNGVEVTEDNFRQQLPPKADLALYRFYHNCSELVPVDDSPFILSKRFSEVDLDSDFSDQEEIIRALFKYVVNETCSEAMRRDIDLDTFEDLARQIFINGDYLEELLQETSRNYGDNCLNSGFAITTEDSDLDVLHLTAMNALAYWCQRNEFSFLSLRSHIFID